MDIGSLAGALVAAQASQLQGSIGTTILRQSLHASDDVAKMLQASQENLAQLANAAAGLGQNLDITV